jgi:two-component sensor histidine kinase
MAKNRPSPAIPKRCAAWQKRSSRSFRIIQAIAQKSLSGGTSLDQAREIFEARLQALGRVHRELMRSNWSGVSLDDLVRLTLKPYAARVNIKGEAIKLGQKDAQNFSLAVHELATNSVKYGALSNAQGRINVGWTLNEQGAGSVLRSNGRNEAARRWLPQSVRDLAPFCFGRHSATSSSTMHRPD